MKFKHENIRNKIQFFFSQLRNNGFPITHIDEFQFCQVISDQKKHGRFSFHKSGTIVQISDTKTNQMLELDNNELTNIVLIGFTDFISKR